jgi:hypothetical protein
MSNDIAELEREVMHLSRFLDRPVCLMLRDDMWDVCVLVPTDDPSHLVNITSRGMSALQTARCLWSEVLRHPAGRAWVAKLYSPVEAP